MAAFSAGVNTPYATLQLLSQKRKAEGPPETDEPQCAPTLSIRPGSSNVLGQNSTAAALSLRLHGGGSTAAAKPKFAQDEEGCPVAVDVSGFERKELNGRYTARPEMIIFGRRSYWTRETANELSRRFLVWQRALGRWAICERANPGVGEQIEAAEEVEFCGSFCPWLAFQLDQAHFTEPCRWMERGDDGWLKVDDVTMAPAAQPLTIAPLKPAAADPKPLSVEFTGFRRLELNAKFAPRLELLVQGKPTYWDSSSRLFIYWQGTLRRWAICSKRSLDDARRGSCPGCACQLDQVHFSSPSRWVEYQDRAWVSVSVEVNVHLPPTETEDGAAVPESSALGSSS